MRPSPVFGVAERSQLAAGNTGPDRYLVRAGKHDTAVRVRARASVFNEATAGITASMVRRATLATDGWHVPEVGFSF